MNCQLINYASNTPTCGEWRTLEHTKILTTKLIKTEIKSNKSSTVQKCAS